MKHSAKRAASAVSACLLVLCLPAGAAANSGPTYWENAPSFSMTPLVDCPVRVDGETLTFDFSGGLKSTDEYSPAAAVTADYKMTNPTVKPLTVQMAFPLIASLADLSQMSGVEIAANGKSVPFRIAPGSAVKDVYSDPVYYNSSGSLVKTTLPSFSAILQSVKTENPVLKRFAGKGKLYRVTGGGQAKVTAFFLPPEGSLAVLSSGVNGYSQEGPGVKVEGYVRENDPAAAQFSLLVFGWPSTPSITVAPEDGEQPASKAVPSPGSRKPSAASSSAGGASWKVRTSEEDAEAYVNELVRHSSIYQKYPTQDLLNRLTRWLLQNAENSAAAGNHVFSDSSVYDFYNQPRVIVLAYEVAFPANGAVDVSVRYPMGGTMDSRNTAQPLYTYGYLLNPAKGWASFRNLNIYVRPSAADPYVVKSSIPLTRDGSGNYSASLNSLPENDLVFSLYPKGETEPKGAAPLRPEHWAVIAFILLLAAVLAAVGIRRPGHINRGPMP